MSIAVDAATRTINLVAAALGGEGGGVFTDWVIEVADRENWLCQSTSLAGVAQRTGATIYYLELFPRGDASGASPVMSLFPAQGDIDIAVVSEIAEAGRMVQRGFVTADRTTLIASDHRVYGITEKVDLGDGSIDPLALQAIAGRYAKDYIHYDMLALANQHDAVISAVLLGGLAGSGALPFSKDSYEAVIEAGGKAVASNLAAFRASYERARSGGVESFTPAATRATAPTAFVTPPASTARGAELLQALSEFPATCREVLYHGLEKLVDYQDYDYADQYLDELRAVLLLDGGEHDHRLTRETARYLALWMCYEDVPRVAQFKTRAARGGHIRDEVKAEPGQLFHVTEFFRPRVEELCALLPPVVANAILNSRLCTRFINLFTGGKRLRTDTVTMFVLLRLLAGLRRWRRGSLGYQREHVMIQRWLRCVKAAASDDPALARELSESGRMVKGYGATRQRTAAQLLAILEQAERADLPTASAVAGWREAALADDEGAAFRASLAQSRAA